MRKVGKDSTNVPPLKETDSTPKPLSNKDSESEDSISTTTVSNDQKGLRKSQKELSGVMAQARFQHSLGSESPQGLTKVGLVTLEEPRLFSDFESFPLAKEAMVFLLFPSYHSKPGPGSPEFKKAGLVIAGGGDWFGASKVDGKTILNTYGEFAKWALQKDGLPDNPPVEQLEQCLDLARKLEGAGPAKVKEAIAERLTPGGPPILIPLEIPGHQTYVTFEQPKDSDKVIMRYFDRQRPNLEIECKGGKKEIQGYLGGKPDFKREKSTELCFEFRVSDVKDGQVVETLLESVKENEQMKGPVELRKNMIDNLSKMAEDVYTAKDSRPQVAQHSDAINCTWASFESFLSHIHGNQFKYEVARMREFIIETHLAPNSDMCNAEAIQAARVGIEKALKNPPDENIRQALERAQTKLNEIK